MARDKTTPKIKRNAIRNHRRKKHSIKKNKTMLRMNISKRTSIKSNNKHTHTHTENQQILKVKNINQSTAKERLKNKKEWT